MDHTRMNDVHRQNIILCDDDWFSKACLSCSSSRSEQTPLDAWISIIKITIINIIITIINIIIMMLSATNLRRAFLEQAQKRWKWFFHFFCTLLHNYYHCDHSHVDIKSFDRLMVVGVYTRDASLIHLGTHWSY